MYVVVLQCTNQYMNLSVSERRAWWGVAYGDRFETFNYGGRQRTSADSVATDATESETRRVGGLVWL